MKEIDFLPEWYRQGRKRRVVYYWQYAVILGIFGVMIMWSFYAGAIVSRGQAQINDLTENSTDVEKVNLMYEQLEQEHKGWKEKADILERAGGSVVYSRVIGELSFLLDEDIVLSSVEISAEEFKGNAVKSKGIRVAGAATSADKDNLLEKDYRHKVRLKGIAAQASDVAEFIRSLESSDYFFQVIVGYSRNKEFKDFLVTEFDISCYVANYRVKQID